MNNNNNKQLPSPTFTFFENTLYLKNLIGILNTVIIIVLLIEHTYKKL